MSDWDLEIELSPKLTAYFSMLSDAELVAASGLELPSGEQYRAQRETMHQWARLAVKPCTKGQRIAYLNVPILAMAEVVRRSGAQPTVDATIDEVIRRGFKPKRAQWSGVQLRKAILGYVRSAEDRGLCRLS